LNVPTIELTTAIPVIPVPDVPAAIVFYRDQLGFTPLYEEAKYVVMARSPVEVHLDGYAEWPRPATTFRINLRGVDALYGELEPKGIIDPDEPLETKPHGMRQFSLRDPWGNRITFAEPTG
jgi:catechol 2,3-dioxygenase-like lactoylglutathione lyase family enzyme